MVNDGTGAEHTMRAIYVEVDPPSTLSWREVDSGMLTTIGPNGTTGRAGSRREGSNPRPCRIAAWSGDRHEPNPRRRVELFRGPETTQSGAKAGSG